MPADNNMQNYYLFLPANNKYYGALWQFLDHKKFQIHNIEFRKPDLVDEKLYLKMKITVYFPIQQLTDHLVQSVTVHELHRYGGPSYQLIKKHIPRKWVRRVKSASDQTIQL